LKNQYFGDVNDYLKYGLLRCFAASGLDLGVCWYLTRDDGSNNGNDRKYLEQPSWRDHDPELYDFLQTACAKPSTRTVGSFEASGLLPARYFSDVIPESEAERLEVIERAGNKLSGAHLVFFDPDNGIETKTTTYGGRGSSRYVFWREIEPAWENGASLLIYQHFPRQEHDAFATGAGEALRQHTHGSTVFTLATSQVVYLLAAQQSHLPYVRYALGELESRFGEHFTLGLLGDPEPEVPIPALEAPAPKYPINVYWSEAINGWVAQMPDLPECAALGATPQSAVEKAMAALDHWIALAREEGRPLPAATDVSGAS
jgi:predicted RNase H-like HicB family nuclease